MLTPILACAPVYWWRATQSTYVGDPAEVGECWETRDERGRLR